MKWNQAKTKRLIIASLMVLAGGTGITILILRKTGHLVTDVEIQQIIATNNFGVFSAPMVIEPNFPKGTRFVDNIETLPEYGGTATGYTAVGNNWYAEQQKRPENFLLKLQTNSKTDYTEELSAYFSSLKEPARTSDGTLGQAYNTEGEAVTAALRANGKEPDEYQYNLSHTSYEGSFITVTPATGFGENGNTETLTGAITVGDKVLPVPPEVEEYNSVDATYLNVYESNNDIRMINVAHSLLLNRDKNGKYAASVVSNIDVIGGEIEDISRVDLPATDPEEIRNRLSTGENIYVLNSNPNKNLALLEEVYGRDYECTFISARAGHFLLFENGSTTLIPVLEIETKIHEQVLSTFTPLVDFSSLDRSTAIKQNATTDTNIPTPWISTAEQDDKALLKIAFPTKILECRDLPLRVNYCNEMSYKSQSMALKYDWPQRDAQRSEQILQKQVNETLRTSEDGLYEAEFSTERFFGLYPYDINTEHQIQVSLCYDDEACSKFSNEANVTKSTPDR